MKKKILRLIPMVVIMLCALVVLSACSGKVNLDDPENITYNGTTISWDSVENASGYTISINDIF